MKILKAVGLIFVMIIFFICFAVWFFFITDQGVYLVLNTLTSRVSGLKVSSISGNWWHGVTIRGLYYRDQAMLVHSSELCVSLDFRSLWWNKSLGVRSLSFKDCFVCMETDKFNRSLFVLNKSKGSILGFIKQYPIVFHNIILNNLYIKLDKIVILLNTCSTGLICDKKSFTISSTFFSGLKVLNLFDFSKIKLPKLQMLSLKDVVFGKSCLYSMLDSVSSNFCFSKKKIEKIMSYNLIFERIEGENLSFSGQGRFVVKKICVQGILSKRYAQLVLLDIISPIGKLRVSGHMKFNMERPVNLTVNFQSNSSSFLRGEKIHLVISGSLNRVLYFYSDFFGSINGYLVLKVLLKKAYMPVDLILSFENSNNLFINGFDCLIRKFRVDLNGTYKDYKLSAKSVISSEKLAFFVTVAINFVGNVNNLFVSHLSVKNDSNTVLDARGIISNKNNFSDWDVKLILKEINMVSYSFIWPTYLSGEINMQVFFDHEYCRLKFFDIILRGVMRECYPVYLYGLLCENSYNIWGVSRLFLSIGSNRLEVVSNDELKRINGIITTINFPILNDIFPDFMGSLFGEINISSTRDGNYIFLLSVISKLFYWISGDLKIDNILLEGNLQYQNILKGSLKCELNQLISNSLLLLPKLVFQIIGDVTNHDLKLSMYTSVLNIIVKSHGFLDYVNGEWYGNILKVNLVKKKIHYKWNKRIMIFYRNLPHEFVFLTNNAEKCVFRIRYLSFLEKRETEKIRRYFQNIHCIFYQSFLLRTSSFNGVCIFSGDLIWDKGKFIPDGKILLLGKGIEWIHMLLGEKLFVACEDFIFDVVLQKGNIVCNWLSKFSDCSQCNGNLEVSLFDQYRCSGKLFFKNISLFFLNMFLDTNSIVKGVLDLDLKFRGVLFHPEIYGEVKLTNFIMQGNQVPFKMTDSTVLLNFIKYRAVLSGVIGVAHRQLYLNGNIHWNNIRSVYSRVHIRGYDIGLNLSPGVNVDVSPVIVFEMTPNLLSVKGTLDLPKGYVEIKEYLKNIEISSDSVVVNEDEYDIFRYGNDFTTIVNVIVRFGNNVAINTSVLDAELRGVLEIIYDNQGLRLKGYINISKGSLNVYGQSLLIKKGQLLFSGLIDDIQPYLNIEAVRSAELIQNSSSIVGIRITGSFFSPEVEVFSNCYYSQEETMSYLLSGQSLEILNMNSNNTIRSILIKLGLFRIEKFVKQFGGVIGIKDLVLSTYGFGNNSQIVLSGYVAPGLQIKYGIGIFDSLATATIRYSLLPNFYLEAVYGDIQSIDLVYQFKY